MNKTSVTKKEKEHVKKPSVIKGGYITRYQIVVRDEHMYEAPRYFRTEKKMNEWTSAMRSEFGDNFRIIETVPDPLLMDAIELQRREKEMDYREPKFACRFCDKPLPESFRDKTCDACWEITSRLEFFLTLPKGREYILEMLRETADEKRKPVFLPENIRALFIKETRLLADFGIETLKRAVKGLDSFRKEPSEIHKFKEYASNLLKIHNPRPYFIALKEIGGPIHDLKKKYDGILDVLRKDGLLEEKEKGE